MNMTSSNNFLPHLNKHIPKAANNYMLSTYSIIQEAWKRGLSINIRILREASGSIEPYYSISDGIKTHHFSATRGDLVSVEAKELTKNKQTTKEYLLKNNVPTPEGNEFKENISDEEILNYANHIEYPVVVKPIASTGGRGVIANIQNDEELKEALSYVRIKLDSPHIILEKFYEGDDYRLYVLDNQVIGAIKRMRSNVIGNGKDSIKTLIKNKNKKRMQLPSLSNRPIKVDDETRTLLKRKNYTLDSIPDADEVVYLKTKNNVSAGGDSIDVTDQVSENIKSIAIAAANSFPSLPHCGLDMMVNEEEDTGVIIELNSRAHITQHLFPMEGKARDIPKHIIDLYFPDTKDYNQEEANKLYIDYDFIYNACLSRSAAEIYIPKIPSSPIALKRFIISNCDYTDNLGSRVRRIAFNNKVNGYIKPLENGNIAVIIGGNEKHVGTFAKKLKSYIKRLNPAGSIIEKNRTTPIPHGFYIDFNFTTETTNPSAGKNANEVYLSKYSDLKAEYQKLVKKLADYEQKEALMNLTSKQNKQLKKQLKQFETSTSWKLTKPLRNLGKIAKRK